MKKPSEENRTCFYCEHFNKTYNHNKCKPCWDEGVHKNWEQIKDEQA